MKTRLRWLFFLVLAIAWPGNVRADESIFHKVGRFFTGTPTPTPAPKKKKKTTAKSEQAPTPSHHASPSAQSKAKPSPSPKRTASPKPTPAAAESPSESAAEASGSKPETGGSPAGVNESASETPEAAETIVTAHPSATPSPSAIARKGNGSTVSLSAPEISGYDRYSPDVRKVLDLALSLTTENLSYKYGSADPKNGGMDCSGFIYYVLNQCGMKDVPRDAREQYIWVRKAGKFEAVLGRSQDTFELDALKPGDLLFWTGTYSVDRDPAITHTMIYLGREKANNQRVMIGASDGRTYKGQSRFGVSVFDFTIAGRRSSTKEPGPAFVGYAHIPGLSQH